MTAQNSVILAAGGIIRRKTPHGIEIAVIHRSRYNDWCLPKGKPEPGETLDATALREVKEETGCDVRLTSFAGTIDYLVTGVPKVVFFWNMESEGECAFRSSEEVDQFVWMSPRDALKRLDYPEERDLLARVLYKRHGLGCRGLPRVLDLLLKFFSTRYRRLSGSIDAFCSELEELICKTASPDRPGPCWARAARELLANAKDSLGRCRIDEGWKLLHAATRMRVYGLSSPEIQHEATIVRLEAEKKLDSWRQKAVFKVIGHPECPGAGITAEQLYQAMLLRDEHYNNQAYKDGIFRKKALSLVMILSALLCALLLLFWRDVLPMARSMDYCHSERYLLLGVVLFGLLGSTLSAMTKMTSEARDASRIPELVSATRITFLRVLIGAASGLIIYLFVQSGLVSSIKIDTLTIDLTRSYPLYAISFISGFSERFVLRAVEKVVGKD